MVVQFDPHVHTAASYDARPSVDDVLAAAAEAGLDAVAVTDHDAIEASLRAVDRAPAYGLVAVPGVEVSTADGHLLALGVIERPAPGDPLPATVAAVQDAGGVAVVPHPFQRTRHGVRKRALAGCDPAPDGIEVYNAWLLTGVRNARARTYADRVGAPQLGASDAHAARYVGRARTALAADAVTADAILDAVRAGDTTPVGRRLPLRRYLSEHARAATRRTTRALPPYPAGVNRQ